METLFELVQIFLCILEAYLMFDFFMAFFSLRENLRNKYVKTAIVLITAGLVRTVNALDNSMANIIGMQIIYLSLLFGGFLGNFLKKISCYLVALAIMMGSEFLWVVLMAHPADFAMSHIQNNYLSTIFSMLCIRLLTFILFNVAKRIVRDSETKMDWKNFLIYSIVPVSTLGIMVCMAYLDVDFDSNKSIQGILIGFMLTAIVGDILIFYIFDRYLKSIKKLNQQEVLIAKMELEEKHYSQIEAVNQEHAVFLHDIRHYMRIIGEMASERKNGEILNILSELQVKISDAETEMYSPNILLNTILNEKKKEAIEKNIAFKITIEPEFSIDHIKNIDLIVIMGNLLDNAIDAAEKCPDGFVRVFLFAQNIAHFSVVKIVNNYAGDIKTEEGIIVSSKEDKSKHGFGIKNVSATVEKYGGYLQNVYKENNFTSIVVLPNFNDCNI